jgi:hypothetical protein
MIKMSKQRKPAKPKPTANDATPYVVAFVICENVLFEPDGVASAIRIVDVVTAGEAPPIGEGLVLPHLSLLLIMKAGEARGERTFLLRLVTPETPTVRHPAVTWSFTFTDPPESGQTNRLHPLSVVWAGEGLYHFEVASGDRVLAHTPFRLKLAEAAPKSAKPKSRQ